MKKFISTILTLLGIVALFRLTAEPVQLNAAWAAGEVLSLATMILAFRGADRLQAKNNK